MNKFLGLFSVRRLVDCRQVSTRLTADGKEVPKRKNFESRITLIGTDNSVSITDLKNAQNLSLRRELKLVKVQDENSKTRRPVYRLMTNAEYHAEELEQRQAKQAARQNNTSKGDKLLTLSSKIGEHDLMTSVRKMLKLVEKQYEVRVVVTGEGEEASVNSDRIYSVIEKNVRTAAKIVQKRVKGNTLRFQLLPARDSSSQSDKSDSDRNSSQAQSSSSGDNAKNNGPL